MSPRVAINGFGRIGRQALRAMLERTPEIDIVAVNGRRLEPELSAHLFKRDSTYGSYPGSVDASERSLLVDGRRIELLAETDPARLPWSRLGVEIVVDATGANTERARASAHLAAGASRVVITAPSPDADLTVVLGVNERDYDPDRHRIISNASCTTNCLAPVAKVISEQYGIEHGLMTTIHSYTNDQRLLDGVHKDPRRARAAGQNLVPTTTGAASSLSLVLPELAGRLDGYSVRVPTPTVSLVDLTVRLERATTVESVHAALRDAAAGPLSGILGVSDEPLVSSDFRGDPRSAIVDAPSTLLSGDRLLKLVAWYDNEWGYSCRIADLVRLVGMLA
jgi:glyceraldehyde 3-phosphate dehydrogenase